MGVGPSQPKYLRDTKTRRFYIPLEVQSQAMCVFIKLRILNDA
jgi:hypothetical protein